MDQIFKSCNEMVKRPRSVSVQWRENTGPQSADWAETLECDEFVEAICRISALIQMPLEASQAHRVLALFDRYLNEGAKLPTREWEPPDPESALLVQQHQPELMKVASLIPV